MLFQNVWDFFSNNVSDDDDDKYLYNMWDIVYKLV